MFQNIFFSYWYWGIKWQRSAKRWKKKITFGHRSYESHFGVKCQEKNITLGHRSYKSRFHAILGSYQTGLELMCMFVFIGAERKVLLKIKLSQILFQKKYTSSCKYIKRTKVSWEVHTLYVFRSKQDKKDFRSATLVLLYQVKLNIARQNGYANKTSFCCIYLENKLRHELSGIRKKGKPFASRVLSVRMQNWAQQDKAK